MRVGFDSEGNELNELDICTFELNNEFHEGRIIYEEDIYSFVFDTLNREIGCVAMYKVNPDSILRLYTTEELLQNDEEYRKWNTITLG